MNAMTPAPDEPVDYQASSDFVWTEKAYESLQVGNDLRGEVISRGGVMASRVWGRCPRCNHFIDDRQTLSALANLMGVRGGRPGAGAEAETARFAQVDVSCGCTGAHNGAPAGRTGCGTSFRVELLVLDPDGGITS